MTATSAVPTRTKVSRRWRVVDIVVAAVIAVAGGVAYWAWALIYAGPSTALDLLFSGAGSLTSGVWILAGVLAALVVRKPGAALFAEIVAASVETLIGAKWGPVDLVYGVVQGLGVELVFALFLYSSWRAWTAILAGAVAGVGGSIVDLIFYYPGSAASFVLVHTAAFAVSGALLAGLVSWLIARALAATGALNRFASGRGRAVDV